MTDIEQKALALVNEVLAEWGVLKNAVEVPKNSDAFARALLNAIEQHEAFRQEVSDAVVAAKAYYEVPMYDLSAFIIAKPDPLVEAWQIAFPGNHIEDARDECAKISAAIEKRGGKIVWGEGA